MQYRYNPTVTTASGTWSGSTLNMIGGICCQIYAKSTSSDTMFDLKIVDESDIEVRKFVGAANIINDLTKWSVQGVLTITIENATADEFFDFLMIVEE